ncbi:GNAT family N-acetyltransferase [Streptomyces sp. L7]
MDSLGRPDKFTIRRATSVAEVAAAEYLFDGPVRAEWAERFLTAGGHHLFLAYDSDGGGEEPTPVGFVSGVETTHPDKGTEMLLYELAVAEPYRRRGLGRALVRRLDALAAGAGLLRDVGADRHRNDVALATYRSAGGKDDGSCSVVTWDFT